MAIHQLAARLNFGCWFFVLVQRRMFLACVCVSRCVCVCVIVRFFVITTIITTSHFYSEMFCAIFTPYLSPSPSHSLWVYPAPLAHLPRIQRHYCVRINCQLKEKHIPVQKQKRLERMSKKITAHPLIVSCGKKTNGSERVAVICFDCFFVRSPCYFYAFIIVYRAQAKGQYYEKLLVEKEQGNRTELREEKNERKRDSEYERNKERQ